jgi:hypothetical protein
MEPTSHAPLVNRAVTRPSKRAAVSPAISAMRRKSEQERATGSRLGCEIPVQLEMDELFQ